MSERPISRRDLLRTAAVTAGAAAVPLAAPAKTASIQAAVTDFPTGTIGKAKLSRVLLGGNLISGYLHCRDLKYVHALFRAYATEQKILETLALAEANGINTVFETGGEFVQKYNKERGGRMQFIPHIEVSMDQSEAQLKEHIQKQVDTGAVALYVWGVSSDTLLHANQGARLARAVELAKGHGLPIGVGSHSLAVPMEMEKLKAPVDFYVKTIHRDDYPTATPKEQRRDFMWLTGEGGFYDNMWCINPQETIEFMRGVAKPWIGFKVLAAGAYLPRDGFRFAFENGADFIAVGMFDFQVRENCKIARDMIAANKERARPWRA